jgi:hypothetical protein
VAAFVDFENIRYSTINSFGQEPNPISWRDKALSYGLMAVARAYADFDQHPPNMRMKLDVAGFEAQHYPAKRTSDAQGREKIQSRADLNFVVDVINTALTRPDIETFLLFTGDKDFIRLVTTLRNRLGKRSSSRASPDRSVRIWSPRPAPRIRSRSPSRSMSTSRSSGRSSPTSSSSTAASCRPRAT